MSKKSEAFDEVVGAAIRSKRRAVEMSQTELADALDVSFQQVQKYENGTNRLRLADFVKVCKVMKSKPDEVLREILRATR